MPPRKPNTDRRGRQGAAMTASGGVLAGTGLMASGVPGAREPEGLELFNLRGKTRKQRRTIANGNGFPDKQPHGMESPFSRSNRGHNARKLLPQPRAGLLGYRASVHDAWLKDTREKMPKNPTRHESGMLAGQAKSEHEIVRGMRMARRGFYGATIGGGALIAGGIRRQHQPNKIKKRDYERGAGAGAAGATAGGLGGAYAGLRVGPTTGSKIINRKIKGEWEREHGKPLPKSPVKGMTYLPVGGQSFPRRLKAVGRGLKGGVLIGTATLGTAGYMAARGPVNKRSGQQSDRYSSAAVAGGLTTAGVGEAARRGLRGFERKYERRTKDNTLRAQQLAPHYGGLHVEPAKENGFGGYKRQAKVTMKPEVPNWKIGNQKADPAKGHQAGEKLYLKTKPEHRYEAARLRGMAAQEKHFAEVFHSTGRGFGMMRGPGLAVAGMGAAGLAASRSTRKDRVHKGFGYEQKRVSPLRATEAAVGVSLLGWGGSRLGLTKTTLAIGSRKAGNAGINFRRAEKARKAVEHTTSRGASMIGQSTGIGVRLRPIEATVAGGVIANDALPIRRKTFTPVNVRTQQGGY